MKFNDIKKLLKSPRTPSKAVRGTKTNNEEKASETSHQFQPLLRPKKRDININANHDQKASPRSVVFGNDIQTAGPSVVKEESHKQFEPKTWHWRNIKNALLMSPKRRQQQQQPRSEKGFRGMNKKHVGEQRYQSDKYDETMRNGGDISQMVRNKTCPTHSEGDGEIMNCLRQSQSEKQFIPTDRILQKDENIDVQLCSKPKRVVSNLGTFPQSKASPSAGKQRPVVRFESRERKNEATTLDVAGIRQRARSRQSGNGENEQGSGFGLGNGNQVNDMFFGVQDVKKRSSSVQVGKYDSVLMDKARNENKMEVERFEDGELWKGSASCSNMSKAKVGGTFPVLRSRAGRKRAVKSGNRDRQEELKSGLSKDKQAERSMSCQQENRIRRGRLSILNLNKTEWTNNGFNEQGEKNGIDNELESPWGVKGEVVCEKDSIESGRSFLSNLVTINDIVSAVNQGLKGRRGNDDDKNETDGWDDKDVEMLKDEFVEYSTRARQHEGMTLVERLRKKSGGGQ